MNEFWSSLIWFIVGGLVGAVIAFFWTRSRIQKELQENPPVTPDMIRAMYMQMGRKPSEAQINQVIKAMNAAAPKKNKKK